MSRFLSHTTTAPPLSAGHSDDYLVSLFKISQSASVRLEGLDGLNRRLRTSVKALVDVAFHFGERAVGRFPVDGSFRTVQ